MYFVWYDEFLDSVFIVSFLKFSRKKSAVPEPNFCKHFFHYSIIPRFGIVEGMATSRFIHLHTHSHYSFLQALPKIDELVEKAKKEGMDALALTDAGNMHGAIEFY